MLVVAIPADRSHLLCRAVDSLERRTRILAGQLRELRCKRMKRIPRLGDGLVTFLEVLNRHELLQCCQEAFIRQLAHFCTGNVLDAVDDHVGHGVFHSAEAWRFQTRLAPLFNASSVWARSRSLFAARAYLSRASRSRRRNCLPSLSQVATALRSSGWCWLHSRALFK